MNRYSYWLSWDDESILLNNFLFVEGKRPSFEKLAVFAYNRVTAERGGCYAEKFIR
ncbi:hypothetical protein [Candidatus Leptofilum sp.]|uniref:hypothetical protein n=1 Tax=Candidatus Leptofilum sp. TaxID=3241576 RepID=UPI003B5A8DD5